jgi:hypothetical protein
MFRKLKLFIRKILIMARIPVAINGGVQPTGDFSHSWGKYSYGYIDKADFGSDPGGLQWKASYDFTGFGGGKYFIISDSYTEGLGIPGDTVPTFHVTGGTNNEIVYLVKRLHSIKIDNPSISTPEEAKNYVVFDANLNHFDADLSNYRYYAQDFLKLNFDIGNLNCDIKENSGSKLYNLVVDASPKFSLDGTGSITFTTINSNKATANRRLNVGTFYTLNDFGAGLLNTLNNTANQPFMFAFRLNVEPPASGVNTIFDSNSGMMKLSVSSTNSIAFKLGNVTVQIQITPNSWETILVGRDINNVVFITDGTNTDSLLGDGNSEAVFTNGFQIGGIPSTGRIDLGMFQYWKDYDSAAANIHSTLDSHQVMSRWS